MLGCTFKVASRKCYLAVASCLTVALFAGLSLSEQRQIIEQLKRALELLAAHPDLKRSSTGQQEYPTLLTQDLDEIKLWNAEVLNINVRVFNVM